jgi:hypothetical protein
MPVRMKSGPTNTFLEPPPKGIAGIRYDITFRWRQTVRALGT